MAALRGLNRSSPLIRHNAPLIRTCNHFRRLHLALDAPFTPQPVAPLLPSFRFAMPSITTLNPIITGIWDSILRAVPKKKTTHSQKRKRQLIGKALEDKKNITRCEACGDLKLLHTLCGSCVKAIQKDWRDRERMGL
jgi:large subunit ribosomal protein L32